VTTKRHGPSEAGNRAREQLYEIVFLLASETGGIEERLARAHAQLLAVDSSVLPPEAREKFDEIRAALTALYPTPGKVDGVDQNQAINVAMGIILLYDDLNHA
jgi:hypothetical protein